MNIDTYEYWICENCGLISADEKEKAKIQNPFQPIKWKCKRCGGRVDKLEMRR